MAEIAQKTAEDEMEIRGRDTQYVVDVRSYGWKERLMIASICRALRRASSGEAVSDREAAERGCGLTRSEFLGIMTTGLLSVGLASTAGRAFAASRGGIPPVTDLDKFYDAWQDRFNAADIEGLLDLYVSDCTYINPDGKLLMGTSSIRADFEGLFALKPQVVLQERKHVVYQDTALTTNHWKLQLTNVDGTNQELTGGGIEVVRKQADGGWRFIIDDASRSAS